MSFGTAIVDPSRNPMSTLTEIIWSHYQQDIFDFVANGQGSAVIEANAGSAKTTTLVEAARRLDEWSSAVCIAFNKRIADELSRRLPTNVSALTLNALGFRAWKKFTEKTQEVDKFKVGLLVKELTGDQNPDFRNGVKRLVDLAKMAGIVPSYVRMPCQGLRPDEPWVWEELIEEYGVDFGWGDKDAAGIELARRVLAESIRVGAQRIDFNDQLYLPVIFGADFQKYEIVFVDEAQDVSEIQRVMIERSLAENGRLIAVGDPNQSIYQFRGAGKDAMQRLGEKFNARYLPLSICYRCSKAIIRKAQEFVPGIQSWEGAEEGLVDENYDWTPETFRTTDVILCRNNAPLVKMAFRLIRSGKACKVVGRDIGTGLAALVKKMRAATIPDLQAKLSKHLDKELPTLNPDQQASLLDRVETIRVFAENSRSAEECVQKIEAMFSDEAGSYLRLSTVHKFKGLEAPRVFLLNPELIGARAKTEADNRAERNIWYVAVTRAQKELYFIRSN